MLVLLRKSPLKRTVFQYSIKDAQSFFKDPLHDPFKQFIFSTKE